MGKHAKRAEGESVDQASAESFPASDPPSWTLGASSASPSPPPGTLGTPAPRAALSAPDFTNSDVATRATLLSHVPSADSALLWAGSLAATAGFFLTLRGEERIGRAFGQGGIALLLAGLLRRISHLDPSAPAASAPPVH